MEEHEKCNDPPCRYDITTLNREKFQIFLNENSVNLLMKNESKFFFSIYIHQTMHHYLSEYIYIYIGIVT